jgi:PAS domain S-box-containing protein
LRQSEQRRLLLSELTAGFTFALRVDADGTAAVDWVSEGFRQATGFTLEELNARGGWESAVHPEDLPAARHSVERLRANQQDTGELRIITKGGEVRWLRYLARPVWDQAQSRVVAVHGAGQDVTEGWRARQALEASERRFRSLIDNAWDGISLLAPDGAIRYTSPAQRRLLGYADEEVLGRSVFDFLHPDDQAPARTLLAEVLQRPGGRATAPYRLRHRDGSWHWVESTAVNLLHEPSVQAVVVNYHDIGERKRAEEALRQADRRKDEFLAMLAHELRNPLAPVRNGLEILRRLGREDTLAEKVRAIMERQVQHLTRLVDDLLDVARITHGTFELRKGPVDLAAAVNEALDICRPLLEGRHQELTVHLPGRPVRLEADRARLTQILTNLLDNAARYTPPGGQVCLSAEAEGAAVVLRVRDTGRGIAAERLPRIFEPFEHADPGQGSLGIGLTLVRRLAEMHGGSVTVHSEGLGQGSEFVVRLPAWTGGTNGEGPGQPKGRPPPGAVAPKRRILVVDDDEDVAKSLAMLLRLEGHEVRVASGGARALAAVAEERPEVVLLDLGLPDVDGYRVAQQLRQLPGGQGLLLVAVTGYAQEADRQRCREAGFDHHLAKPVDLAGLHRVLTDPKLTGTQGDKG